MFLSQIETKTTSIEIFDLLEGKGTANNPGTVGDIHSMEAQELTALLKDASKADTPPTAVPESPTGSPLSTELPSQSQSQSSAQQKIQSGDQTVQLEKPASRQDAQQFTTSAQPLTTGAQQQVTQPHFNGDQLKELRDFARMYKMYQFIKKMEERLNDPDCAPICRKMCKNFCPAKCCRGQKVSTNVVSHLMQTANKIKGNAGQKIAGVTGKQRTGMEDNGNDDSEEQDEKKMDNDAAGKKHILIKIVKNNLLDKPRRNIANQ
jgi:hypothetical protein